MSAPDFHLFRTDPQVRWQGIAAVLAMNTESWEWALSNIERWLAQGRLHPGPLLEWRQVLREAHDHEEARGKLLNQLRRAPANAHEEQLRSCSPFVGGPFRVTTSPILAA